MNRSFSTVFLLSILFVGLVYGTSGASAAPPEHNKRYRELELVCDGESHTVVSIAHSQAVAFQSIDAGGTFILVSFEVLSAEGDVITIPVGQGNRAGQEGRLIVCETPDLDTLRASFRWVP